MLQTVSIQHKPGLIVALDEPNVAKALHLARQLDAIEANVVLKVGRRLEQEDDLILQRLRKACKLPLIYDGKIADIPDVSREIALKAFDSGADAVIMQGFVGPSVISALTGLCRGDVIVVASMSHPDSQLGIDLLTNQIITWALQNGAAGLVLPATRPAIIGEVKARPDYQQRPMYIISPGIKTQGAESGVAIRNGATYEVVGRAIVQAESPLTAALSMYENIKSIVV